MAKGKAQIAIKNAISGGDNVLELYFLDYIQDQTIYDWFYGVIEYSVVQDVMQQIRDANPSKIRLIIDSEGGSASIGIALYNILKATDARIETDTIFMAGSIASVLVQAANKGKRTMARNGFMVIHQAWGGVEGNAEDLRKGADVIDMYTAQIVDIYARNNTAGLSAKDINALIANGDYWMDAEEAQRLGFVDSLYNDGTVIQVAARIQTLDAHYKNVPDTLKALVSPPAPQATVAPAAATSTTEEAPEGGTPAATSAQPEAKTGNIAQTIKNAVVVKFNELVQACMGKIKNKGINPTAANLSEEVANQLGGPLTELAEAMQAETEEAMQAQETAFNERLTAVTNRLDTLEQSNTALTQANATLTQQNGDLTRQLAEATGGESGAGGNNAAKKDLTDWSAQASVSKVNVG